MNNSNIDNSILDNNFVDNSIADAEMNDNLFTYEVLKNEVLKYAIDNNMHNAKLAIELMDKYHSGAFRKGKKKVPYAVHPLTLAKHAIALGIADDCIISVCLLHDVLEDTSATVEALHMPEEILDAVQRLTFVDSIAGSKDEAMRLYYERIAEHKVASLVKLLDRCNNISNMAKAFGVKKISSYVNETYTYVLPIFEGAIKDCDEWKDAVFVLKYQILAVLETVTLLLDKVE